MTSVGDWNGDGYTDLIAHDTRNGKLWMYPGTKNGTLGARTQIGSGWQSMPQIN